MLSFYEAMGLETYYGLMAEIYVFIGVENGGSGLQQRRANALN